ncbi:RagB/SusD family nutrient uptake outer membrane protein [Pontibacter sp. SGAir0037]|uniref:RagB/SusD family nutrient uptake outer membrane protein n=1 Tax=Pontibacter sp. SGAir0037 TaxID=2571030 RepID=UPI00143CF73E|nr:RagB/SusD family nutrient uptake outer membrane protein [Pontibacter sp. SGAir0037]
MKIRNYLFAIMIGIGSTSCEDFLDTEPTNFIAPTYTSIAELETGLAGVYDVLGSQAMYGDVIPYWLNVSTDLEYTNTGQLNTTAYIYTPADAQITNFWKTLYQGIYRANLVLARVDNPDLDQTALNKIKGQALFLRAYYYFLLVSNFGDVPLQLTDKPDINNVNVPRTPAKEVYEQIIKDMTEAEGLVEEAANLSGGGRVSRSAVQGILARVCLTMAGSPVNDKSKYAEALKWATKVKESGMHALNPDYSSVFIKYAKDEYDIRESIWEVEFYGLLSAGLQEYTYYVGVRGGIRSSDPELGRSNGQVLATKKLYDLYESICTECYTISSPDMRRDWNIATFTYAGTPGVRTPNPDLWRRTMGKWRREYEALSPKDASVSAQNFPILRYSDVLLMLAEAENEVNGPTAIAYDAINEVRRRGYGVLNEGNKPIKIIGLTNRGAGYTLAPDVYINGVNATASGRATAYLSMSVDTQGQVASVYYEPKPGEFASGYAAPPTITLVAKAGDAGSGATAVATLTEQADADLQAGLSKDEFFQVVKDERARELCFETARRPDLIRWGNFVGDMKNYMTWALANGAAQGHVLAQTNVAERNTLLPIPTYDMSLNKALTQNPGY